MTGRRSKDFHLPTRVYFIANRYRYIDKAGKSYVLGKEWDAEAKAKWIALSDSNAPRGTVASMLDQYMRHAESLVRAKKRAPRTLEDNQKEAEMLKLVFGRMQAGAVTSKHVQQYLVKRKNKNGEPAPVRANREIALLSSAYSWAMGQDDWPNFTNPCYGTRRNTESGRTAYVDSANLVRFSKTAPAWLRGYVMLKRLTGLRQGDMLALSQVNITGRGLEVTTGKTDKRLRFRWTWALRVVVRWVQTHQPQGEGTTALCLFPNRYGQRMTASGFKTAWNRAMTAYVKAGGVWITESDIRAKTATDSKNLAEAQERLGHESASTTNRHYRRGVSNVKPLR